MEFFRLSKMSMVSNLYAFLPWQFLYFLPLPQGQGSFLPGRFSARKGTGFASPAFVAVAFTCWGSPPEAETTPEPVAEPDADTLPLSDLA